MTSKKKKIPAHEGNSQILEIFIASVYLVLGNCSWIVIQIILSVHSKLA